MKLKVGGNVVSRDTKRVEAVRNAAGGDFILACDANLAGTVEQSLEFARNVADLDLASLEEPVRRRDEVDGMSRVRSSGLVTVNGGQSEISGSGCMNSMMAQSVDYLNLVASIAGGIAEWKRIAAAASFYGGGMVHHEEPQESIHLLCAIPHGYCAELFHDPVHDPAWHQMYLDHLEPKNGHISLPDKPGLGM